MAYPNTKPDRSELVIYDKADFPAYIRKGKLSAYPNYSAESHWHDDVELILTLSGQMEYNINGKTVSLRQGEGIFVNARQLHFGYSMEKTECEFLCVLLHPILLCASQTVEQNSVSPFLFQEKFPFYHLQGQRDWERRVLYAVQKIYDVRNDALSGLKIQQAFLGIWIDLCENVISMPQVPCSGSHHLSALKEMISYIHGNYSEKLTLGEIAAAGKVGKTGCCAIFKRYLNKTPNEYVTEFRLRKAMELLQHTDRTILEIGYTVGFSGASYFAETFRKFYGCTPGAYRREKTERND